MFGNSRKVNAEHRKEFNEFDVIDRADAVKLVNTGRCIRIFNLGEPCIGNAVFIVSLSLSDERAFLRDIPSGYSQVHANFF